MLSIIFYYPRAFYVVRDGVQRFIRLTVSTAMESQA